jgi:drug/metabolite transporter (DMT)-like permease
VYAVARGQSFALPASAPFWWSMAFLVLSASVLAFYAYLSLVGRIGPARASYAAVIFPIFSLLISTAFEGYRWTWLAVLGLVLAIAGNVIVLRRE